MNGSFRYRLGMAWRLWCLIPEVRWWHAIWMLRYVPTSQEALDAAAACAPMIAACRRDASTFPLLSELKPKN